MNGLSRSRHPWLKKSVGLAATSDRASSSVRAVPLKTTLLKSTLAIAGTVAALIGLPLESWADAGSSPHDHGHSTHEMPGESMPAESMPAESHGLPEAQADDMMSLPHGDGHHHHRPLEVPAGQPLPSVALTVMDDPVSGWNLMLEVENFQFAPERINQSSVATEGHAHLYINGEKIMRIYSDWHHLPMLEPGDNEVTVTLNANGHEQLTHNGEAIADTVIVTVSGDGS